MITEKDNVFYCDCGFSFERWRSGAHSCETGLRKKIAESEAKLAALAVENAGLKAGVTYFAYSPEYGFDYFKDKQSAIDTAQDEIDAYREDAEDGWSEDVQRVSKPRLKPRPPTLSWLKCGRRVWMNSPNYISLLRAMRLTEASLKIGASQLDSQKTTPPSFAKEYSHEKP